MKRREHSEAVPVVNSQTKFTLKLLFTRQSSQFIHPPSRAVVPLMITNGIVITILVGPFLTAPFYYVLLESCQGLVTWCRLISPTVVDLHSCQLPLIACPSGLFRGTIHFPYIPAAKARSGKDNYPLARKPGRLLPLLTKSDQ